MQETNSIGTKDECIVCGGLQDQHFFIRCDSDGCLHMIHKLCTGFDAEAPGAWNCNECVATGCRDCIASDVQSSSAEDHEAEPADTPSVNDPMAKV